MIELVEEPDLPQGTWQFGEGTIHHQAFDVASAANQQEVKDWIVGLGFTDVSEPKDRGYFFSMYCRSPGGLLVELAYGTPQGFLIDESEDELGHAHVHPAALGGPPVRDHRSSSRSRRSRRSSGRDRGCASRSVPGADSARHPCPAGGDASLMPRRAPSP